MLTIIAVFGLLCAIVLSAFFSGLETAAYSVNRVRLLADLKDGQTQASGVLSLLKDMSLLIITLLIGNNITVDVGTYLLTTQLQSFDIQSAELITTIILTPVYFIFAETLPKRIGYAYPNVFLKISVRVLRIMQVTLTPASYLFGFVGKIISVILRRMGITKKSSTGKDFLADSLEAGAFEGALNERQFAMAQKIISLDSLTVADIMLNTTSAITVSAAEKCEKAGKQILEKGYARALLLNDKNEFSGKLVTLNSIMRNPGSLNQPVEHLAIEAMRIDTRTPVIRAINKMREEGARLAIAVNAGGTPVGAIPFSRMLGCVTGGIKL